MQKNIIIPFVLVFLIAASSYADVFKCTDSSGKVSYLNRPCPPSSSSTPVDLEPSQTKKYSLESPPPAGGKIDRCLKSGECEIVLRGEMAAEPVMSFIVERVIWTLFDENDRNDLRSLLKKKIADAKAHPDNYTSIPSSAPFYREALENIRNAKSYSVITSRGLSPRGTLYVDKEILVNF